MATKEKVDTVVEEVDVNATVDIIQKEDGYYLVHQDGTEDGPCEIVDEGKTIALPKNATCRQWCNIAKTNEAIAADGKYTLAYKAPKKLGSGPRSIPNEALIKYLPEAEQEEYKAIIARAMEAREADRKKPVSQIDKLREKIERDNAKLAELEASLANETTETTEGGN